MDVKTAFLNGDLDEEIYMAQPLGFVQKGQECKVCRLRKSIYGLKKSSRQWYLKFHRAILSYDFHMIDEDHYVHVKWYEADLSILFLYMDDVLIAKTSLSFMNTIKSWLSLNFEMKDFGETEFILGVRIQRDRSKKLIVLSQEAYIEKILE